MTKYLVTIEFRYSDAPDSMDLTYRTKTITIGVYDTIEEAITNGNNSLMVFEEQFNLNTAWNRKERFTKTNRLISELAYLQTPFSFFAKIITLEYSSVEKEIENVVTATTRYKQYKNSIKD